MPHCPNTVIVLVCDRAPYLVNKGHSLGRKCGSHVTSVDSNRSPGRRKRVNLPATKWAQGPQQLACCAELWPFHSVRHARLSTLPFAMTGSTRCHRWTWRSRDCLFHGGSRWMYASALSLKQHPQELKSAVQIYIFTMTHQSSSPATDCLMHYHALERNYIIYFAFWVFRSVQKSPNVVKQEVVNRQNHHGSTAWLC